MIKTVRQMATDIVKREGGFVNDPADAGGPTKHGISLYKYARGKPELDLDHDGDIDINDIKMVTPEIAIECYMEDFFELPGYSKLPSFLHPMMFDTAVNAGAKRSSIILQRAIVNAGIALRSIDGAVGPATIAATKKAVEYRGKTGFNNRVVKERIRFYEDLITAKPSQAKFRKGWTNRANEFLIR